MIVQKEGSDTACACGSLKQAPQTPHHAAAPESLPYHCSPCHSTAAHPRRRKKKITPCERAGTLPLPYHSSAQQSMTAHPGRRPQTPRRAERSRSARTRRGRARPARPAPATHPRSGGTGTAAQQNEGGRSAHSASAGTGGEQGGGRLVNNQAVPVPLRSGGSGCSMRSCRHALMEGEGEAKEPAGLRAGNLRQLQSMQE